MRLQSNGRTLRQVVSRFIRSAAATILPSDLGEKTSELGRTIMSFDVRSGTNHGRCSGKRTTSKLGRIICNGEKRRHRCFRAAVRYEGRDLVDIRLEVFGDAVEIGGPADVVIEEAGGIVVHGQAVVQDSDVLPDHLRQSADGQLIVSEVPGKQRTVR